MSLNKLNLYNATVRDNINEDWGFFIDIDFEYTYNTKSKKKHNHNIHLITMPEVYKNKLITKQNTYEKLENGRLYKPTTNTIYKIKNNNDNINKNNNDNINKNITKAAYIVYMTFVFGTAYIAYIICILI